MGVASEVRSNLSAGYPMPAVQTRSKTFHGDRSLNCTAFASNGLGGPRLYDMISSYGGM